MVKVLNKIVLSFLLILGALNSYAQNSNEEKKVVVQAQVSGKSFYMGQSFFFTILVDGSNKVKPPRFSKLKNFDLKKISERPLQSKEKPGFIIRYEMMPLVAGKQLIPTFSFLVNDKLVTTTGIPLTVKAPATHPALKLSVDVSSKDVYVGEPFLVTFTWKSELPLYSLKAVDVRMPFNENPAFKSNLPWESHEGGSKNTIGLPVSDVRTICSHIISVKGNKRTETLQFSQVVRARYSGEFTLEPASLLCSFIPPSEDDKKNKQLKNWRPTYPSFFNNKFFEEMGADVKYEKYIAKSQSITIKVRDLPLEGRPDNFSGVIGKCRVTTTATPVILEAGSPLQLAVKISNYKFPSVLSMPDVSTLKTFTRNFSVPRQKSSGEYDDNSKTFTQALRPLRTDVNGIPPVRVPYFDPQTGSYSVAQSAEIAITVKPAGKVTAFDAQLSSGVRLKNIMLVSPVGIRHNTTALAALTTSTPQPLILFLLAALVPPLFFLIYYLATANQRLMSKNPTAARSRQAFKNFQNRTKLQSLVELEQITRTYFAEKVQLTKDAHTVEELILRLQAVAKLAECEEAQLRQLYQHFDQQRFADESAAADLAELVQSAQSLVKKINGRIKNV